MSDWLNYHHLYYFWVIAKEGGLTQASQKLRLSASTLSSQLKSLEEGLGQELFERKSRSLVLTEAGKTALSYADTIFPAGRELLDLMRNRPVSRERHGLRVGVMSPLSKNFQFEFLKPVVGNPSILLQITEGSLDQLMRELSSHSLDMALTTMPIRSEPSGGLFTQKLGEFPVCLVGAPRFKKRQASWPKALTGLPVFVPTHESRVRGEWDHYCELHGVRPEILAEIEDMALLRLFARSGRGCAVVPEIVVQTELRSKELVVLHRFPGVKESFYAITPRRKSPNPWVQKLVRGFSLD